MFYSKALLSKKGALGTVWVAAVCGLSALTREQVARTDVAASVDKILPDVETTYRILGLLLLGIVRIYSKKVEYLCHDCDQLLGSFGAAHCTEPSTSTGRAMNGILKQMKTAVCARRLVVDQQDINKVQKPVHAARTTGVSSLIASEGLSSRAETGVTSQTSVEVREARAPADLPIFTMPKRFELDSFDLEIAEDRDDDNEDHHQLPRQDILLEDERHHTSYLYELHQRLTCSYADLDSACFMPVRITIPSEIISAIGEVNNLLYLSNRGDELERDNQNADSACFTPVKDVLPPEMMDTMTEVNDPSEKSNRGEKPRREMDGEENGGSACSIPLPESEEAQRSDNVVENVTCPRLSANCPTIEESENGLLLGKSNTVPSVVSPYHDVEEHESLEPPNLRCKTRSINELSPSTPEPLPEGVTGPLYSPKFMVTTPAKNEKRRVTRKRRRGLYNKEDYIPTDRDDKQQVRRRGTRALYDEDIVLSNEMLRQAIEDASDLVYQRSKAPHTYLDVWKEARIGSLLDTFTDPLIPYSTSVLLSYTTTPDAPESSCGESVKAKRRLSYELSESNKSCKDAQNVEREGIPDEPRKRKLDELTNSIQTPGGCYTEGGQFQDDGSEYDNGTAKEKDTQIKGDESSLAELPEKRLCESKNYSPLRHEALNAAIDNIDEDIPMDECARDEGLLHSTRTRTVARCLHQLFLDQKCQLGNSSVSLGQALEGRKRKTSARFFYETLILKSIGLIQVNQGQPYEDIVVSTTPQLESEFQSGGN